MAVLGINLRPTPQPREKQKDRTFTEKALDNVLKAAQIAQAGYGIYSGYEQIQIKKDELEVTKKDLELKDKQDLLTREENLARAWKDDERARQIVNEYNAATRIDDLTEDNANPQTYAGALMSAVRTASGPGPISDKDIELFAPDPSAMARIKRAYSRAIKGTALQEDVESLRDLAEIIRKRNIRDMDRHAFWFAKSQGRRLGNENALVNKILLPRTRLTGAGKVGNLTIDKVPGLEGQVQQGETRIKIKNRQIPTDRSRQIEEIVDKYNNQQLDPSITAERIDAMLKQYSDPRSGKSISRGQAIWMLDQWSKIKKEISPEKSQRSTQEAGSQPGAVETKGMIDAIRTLGE